MATSQNISEIEFFHGGNLDRLEKTTAFKKGKYEFGVGLYITSHEDTARKYAKGSRKLYSVKVKAGKALNDATLPVQKVYDFIESYVSKQKQKDNDVMIRLNKFTKFDAEGNRFVDLSQFDNMLLNSDLIQPKYLGRLAEFYVENGISYNIVDNAFGWHETMLVVYNTAILETPKRI